MEPEDSFDFGDDNDLFLAALGVEEGDLGRPIETEADIGQPIAHEESFLPPDEDNSMAASDTSTSNILINSIPKNDRANRLQRLQQEIMNASNINPLHTSPPIQQSTPTEQQHTSNATSTRGVSNDPEPVAFRPPHQNHAAHVQRNHRTLARSGLILNHHNQCENVNSSLSDSNSGEFGGKHPLAPSMGGFHFPPGVVRTSLFNHQVV